MQIYFRSILHSESHFEPTALHFVPTAPSVYFPTESSNDNKVIQHPHISMTTAPPSIFSPVQNQDHTMEQLNMSRIDQVFRIKDYVR